jgi:hypothetical protein
MRPATHSSSSELSASPSLGLMSSIALLSHKSRVPECGRLALMIQHSDEMAVGPEIEPGQEKAFAQNAVTPKAGPRTRRPMRVQFAE